MHHYLRYVSRYMMLVTVDPVMTHILKADHLSEETRTGYCKRLALISSAAGNKPLIQVLTMSFWSSFADPKCFSENIRG